MWLKQALTTCGTLGSWGSKLLRLSLRWASTWVLVDRDRASRREVEVEEELEEEAAMLEMSSADPWRKINHKIVEELVKTF